MIAVISATALGVIITGIGVIVSLVVGVIALKSAKAAEKQAAAAARQADSAAKQTEIAESEHQRTTRPRLRIAQLPNGAADMTNHVEPPGHEAPGMEEVYLSIENVREAPAVISRASLGDQLGELVNAQCESGRPGIVSFVVDRRWTAGDKVKVDVRYRARDGGFPGHLDGELERTKAGWRITRELDGPV